MKVVHHQPAQRAQEAVEGRFAVRTPLTNTPVGLASARALIRVRNTVFGPPP